MSFARPMVRPMVRAMSRAMAVASGAAPDPLPLDGTSSSVLAFSIPFKLRTAYSGSAIRVRESGGNTEADIPFDGNVLDTSALLAHCGANDGFITKVYDQSGHASAVDYAQTSASLQPQIVSSGSLITKDGYAAMLQPTAGSGAEFVTLASWNTRPSSAVAVEVWSAPAARLQMAISGNDVGTFCLVCVDSNSSTSLAGNSGGSVTWSKNGTLVLTDGVNTRDDAHTQFNTDALNVVRHNDVSFSNSAYAGLRTEFTVNTSFGGPEYWSSQIIYTDSGETSTIEGRIADLYGITLS